MPIIVKEDPNQYPLPPEGLHHAVCVDVVDLGDLESPWGKKHKLTIIWELGINDEEGKRYLVSKRYTWSLNEKANLRKDLERWRGGKYTPEELQAGVDLEALLGLNATLFVTHNPTDERTYANVESVLPFKNDKGKVAYYDLKPSGLYTRVVEREGYKEPEAYAESANSRLVGREA